MCGMHPVVFILILAAELFVIGYFVVGWFKKLAEYENEKYKNPPPKLDPRVTPEMVEAFLISRGAEFPYPKSETGGDNKVIFLLTIFALIIAGLYIYFAL